MKKCICNIKKYMYNSSDFVLQNMEQYDIQGYGSGTGSEFIKMFGSGSEHGLRKKTLVYFFNFRELSLIRLYVRRGPDQCFFPKKIIVNALLCRQFD
jgi:hypothetical protein